jgi:hypothetical protein
LIFGIHFSTTGVNISGFAVKSRFRAVGGIFEETLKRYLRCLPFVVFHGQLINRAVQARQKPLEIFTVAAMILSVRAILDKLGSLAYGVACLFQCVDHLRFLGGHLDRH